MSERTFSSFLKYAKAENRVAAFALRHFDQGKRLFN